MRFRARGVVVLAALALAFVAAPASASTLFVIHPTPGGGVVTSDPAGISCETFFCGAEFAIGSQVTLTATPHKGFAFAGYSEACTGPSCSLTMDAEKRVLVSFVRFAVIPYSKPMRDAGEGTAEITVRVGGPGELVLYGKNVKSTTVSAAAASNVKLTIAAKGGTLKKLKRDGAVRVGARVAFTPTGGIRARLFQPVRLVLAPPRLSR